MEEYKILAMNFGSTSTKVAAYEGDTQLLHLNERLSFQTYDARPISFCAYAKEVLLRIFRGLFLFCCSFEP